MDIIKKWEGTIFVSSTGKTEQFKQFSRDYKKALKELLNDYELVDWSTGHFYISSFFKKDNKFVYISISDVRHFKDSWIDNILIRTAKNEKDYTGGRNNLTKLENIKETADRLIKQQQ